jgi:Bacterial lipocalin
MGAWFVHGHTPILVDKQAHNAVEHYYLNEKQEVETTYQFRDESFSGELKTYTPTGFPKDEEASSGARWQMQFLWPFKADYVIVHLSDDYAETIIGHPSRKYAWIMTRSPEIADEAYESLLQRLEKIGYDRSVVRRLPHDWSDDQDRLQRIREVGKSAPLAD